MFASRAIIRSLGKNYQIVMKAKSRMFGTLEVSDPFPLVKHIAMNRPDKMNAMDKTMWIEFEQCFNELSNDADCNVIVLSGNGKIFTAGLDLQDAAQLYADIADKSDIAQKCKVLERTIQQYQNSFTAIQKCAKPVIAAVHGACIGAGVDMISAADIRYCSSDAYFQIKEVDLGMAADVGTLQRMPKIIGNDSLMRELAYTGRKLAASEALKCGLVSRVIGNRESLIRESLELAKEIAAKSPVAVQGIKLSLNYSRDHTIDDGLNHILMRNQTMLQSDDFVNAVMALMTKGGPPTFSKL